jgi:sulfate transport system substrate-binding protein
LPPATSSASAASEITLHLAGFTLAREPFENRIVPDFQALWRRTHGSSVRFVTSYEASGAQVRALQKGLPADIAALSLSEDVEALVHSGLVSADWKSAPYSGIVSRSIVVIAVRKGNPASIHDWSDLVRGGLRVVTPDPRSSGAGRWNVAALYGAGLRGTVDGGRDDAAAEQFLEALLARVVDQNKDAYGSFKAFDAGMGDVAIASESQVIRSRMFGNECEAVIPRSSLRIDNPVAIVDAQADAHGVREAARAFRDFLWTREAQRAFAFYGARPVDPAVAKDNAEQFPMPEDLWTIDDLGGWAQVSRSVFGPGGLLERASSGACSESATR